MASRAGSTPVVDSVASRVAAWSAGTGTAGQPPNAAPYLVGRAVASLTMAQTYALARQAGFDPAAAVIMAAIAAGESGLRVDAIGDTGLVDAKWGPSVGLPQIRTLKADTGTGRLRDISRLSGDPLQQMVAAYEISSHGRDFTPWTVYTSGKYRSYLGQASSAATVTPVIAGANVVPVGLMSDTGARLQQLAVLGVVVVLGVALVVLGAARATGTGSALAGLLPVGRALKVARAVT